ncbi:hypothetical protein [Euzebyella saccharophila]|uniref:Chloroplast import component protein (Tic20) n=1 Tax=Euzebyella saccharophila TaxID=679664 RepID=A0ABV8JY69_9FLAO|nr:hypothetical protein [Euzebyella saccharophila]
MKENIKEGKTAAITAYFTIVGSLIAISMNAEPKNSFARFHIRQAFGLHLLFIAFGILSSNWGNIYSFFGLMLSYSILWFYGFFGALSEKKQSIPILGPYFQKWFTFIS